MKTEVETPMHTGERDDGWEIVVHFIEAALGIKKDDIGIFWDAYQIMVKRDARIFVPFAGGMPNIQKQVKLYGRTTLEDMVTHFNSKIPAGI